MSISNGLQIAGRILRTGLINRTSRLQYCSTVDETVDSKNETDNENRVILKKGQKFPIIPAETSIRYMESKAYKATYGNDPVWVYYRRNHKGHLPPSKTRHSCLRLGAISTGNPCPICRDEYLVLDYRNVKLLKQFLSPFNGEVLSYQKTGICQKRYKELLVALHKAKDYGTITFDVPFRYYDYSEWQSSKDTTSS